MESISVAGRALALARHKGQYYRDIPDAARALAVARRFHGAGSGRPRKVFHAETGKRCRCVDCRRATGNYPPKRKAAA